jgi:hypothetical protein
MSKNSIDTDYPVEVAAGGTGSQSFVANTPLVGGTTTTNPLQSVASVAGSGQILRSTGTSSIPTFQNVSVSPSLVWLQTLSEDNTSNPIDFTISSTYSDYVLIIHELYPTVGGTIPQMRFSTDGGSTYVNTTYYSGVNHLALGSATLNNVNITSGTQWNIAPALSATNPRYYARINFFNLTNGDRPFYTGECMFRLNGGAVYFGSILGWNGNASTIDRLRLLISSGNWVVRAALYGLAKS